LDYVVDQKRPDLGGNLHHGDLACFTPKVWEYVKKRFSIRSMLDVGCGEGHAVAFFQSMGVLAHGIDGLLLNVQRAVTPVALHDLKRGPYVMPVDLVLCVEVVEHIEEQFLDNLMGTLTNGQLVLMTHALPGQDGHHHVNCQPAEYWVRKFQERGYRLAREAQLVRKMSETEGWPTHFSKSGLLFAKR
jgi:2-polyprenyl-3-methyl-5-hydroxy-6-metoxy-1,4-benzoquinol methylase